MRCILARQELSLVKLLGFLNLLTSVHHSIRLTAPHTRIAVALRPPQISRIEADDIDRHLINVLYRDLVPRRKHGIILKEKWERDTPSFSTVSRGGRLLGVLFVVVVTFGNQFLLIICSPR